jgi:hypothetical protein
MFVLFKDYFEESCVGVCWPGESAAFGEEGNANCTDHLPRSVEGVWVVLISIKLTICVSDNTRLPS